jgi:PAS domain S-box-containing protein
MTVKANKNEAATPETPSPFLFGDNTFRLLVDQITDYAIFLLTPSGEVATWNPGAERIKGFKPHEIIGKHFRTFYSSEAQDAQIPEQELKVAAAVGRFEDEGWRIRKDGSQFWANVIITAIRSQQGDLLGFGKVTRDLSERKCAEERLRHLSYSLLKIQDDERGKLGRELHDTVGQYLVAAKMSLDGVASDDRFDPQVRHRIDDSLLLIDRAIREVRTLSYLLYPPMLEEMGLASAIRWYLEGFSKRSGVQAECERCDDVRLQRDIELALFRVFQESMTNVHRHSQGKTARIRFAVQNHRAVLEVKDDGVGLGVDPGDVNAASVSRLGVGIRGMSERIRQLGGQLSINSTPRGTTVKATVPAEPRSDAGGPELR